METHWSLQSFWVLVVGLGVEFQNKIVTKLIGNKVDRLEEIDEELLSASYRKVARLCNLLCKMVAKTLSNRSKPILPSLISENQSAFVKDGLISGNILLAHEIIHCLKNKGKGRDICLWP